MSTAQPRHSRWTPRTRKVQMERCSAKQRAYVRLHSGDRCSCGCSCGYWPNGGQAADGGLVTHPSRIAGAPTVCRVEDVYGAVSDALIKGSSISGLASEGVLLVDREHNTIAGAAVPTHLNQPARGSCGRERWRERWRRKGRRRRGWRARGWGRR